MMHLALILPYGNKYHRDAFLEHGMVQTKDDPDSPRGLMLAAIPRLRRFAVSLTGSMADGDDLTQLTLERGLARLDQWRSGTRMESWLFRIAYNAWIDEVRARKRRGSVVSLDHVSNLIQSDGQRAADSASDLETVRRAMARLPDEFRAVLVLVVVEGLSYQQTAEALLIPIGTVMSRLARARKALVAALEGSGDHADAS